MTGGFIRSIIAKTRNPNLENSSNGYYPNIVSKINIDHDFDKKTNSRTLTFGQKNRFQHKIKILYSGLAILCFVYFIK